MSAVGIFRDGQGRASVSIGEATVSVERAAGEWDLRIAVSGDLGLLSIPSNSSMERDAIVRGLAVMHAVAEEIAGRDSREIPGAIRHAKALPPRVVSWLRLHGDDAWLLAIDLDAVVRHGA